MGHDRHQARSKRDNEQATVDVTPKGRQRRVHGRLASGTASARRIWLGREGLQNDPSTKQASMRTRGRKLCMLKKVEMQMGSSRARSLSLGPRDNGDIGDIGREGLLPGGLG